MNGPSPHDPTTSADTSADIPADLAAAFAEAAEVPSAPASAAQLQDMQALLAAQTGRRWGAAELSTPMRWGVAVALVGVVAAVVVLGSGRADLRVYPVGRMGADLVLLAVPLLVGFVLALRPISRPSVPSRVRALAAVVGGVAAVGVLSLPVAHTAHPASVAGAGDDFAARAVACFVFGLVYAGLALLGLRALARHRSGWWPGAATVGAAGGVGMLALYLHCPITHHAHLWAGHGTVAALACIALVVLRRRVDG